jgi:hypothetical protein
MLNALTSILALVCMMLAQFITHDLNAIVAFGFIYIAAEVRAHAHR